MTNELCDLRVTGRDLLKNGLEHLRLLLNELAQLLEMRVIPEEIEVRKRFTASASTTGTGTSTFVTSLGSSFKQIDGLIFGASSSGASWGAFSGGCSGGLGGGGSLLLLLLDVFGDTLCR